MAIAVGTIQGSVNFHTSTGLSWAPDAGDDRLALLLGGANDAGTRTLDVLTHNGVAATAKDRSTAFGSTAVHNFYGYWLGGAIQSSGNLAIDWSQAMTEEGNAAVLTITGAEQTPTISVTATSVTTAGLTITHGAAINVTAGQLLIVTCATDTTVTAGSGPGTGYTQICRQSGSGTAGKFVAHYKIIGSDGTETPSYTFGGSNNASMRMVNYLISPAATSSVAPLAAAYYYNR
jgi:hypothetical protein